MDFTKIALAGALAATLVGCGGGDINITPTTVDNSVDNSVTTGGGGALNPCARYTDPVSMAVREGTHDGVNCTYTAAFSDVGNPVLVDLTIPFIEGVHIFEGTLFIGQNFNSNAALTGAGITQGGDGPTVTIVAGNTLAFRTPDDYMVINRGSQIEVLGQVNAPVTMTSWTDAIAGIVGPEDVSEWGGLLINGFGINNDCAYTGTSEVNYALVGECHLVAEGKIGVATTHHGGVNNDDDSGIIRYLVVKHAGFEVEVDNELNGVTFNSVGRNTEVQNIQVYSSTDDGLEMFGGAVNVENYVGLYVRDDAIDFDQSYRGTVTNALVIQGEFTGNQCIESDGISGFDGLDAAAVEDLMTRGLHSQPVIRNVTCIVSPSIDSGKGDGGGPRFREGIAADVANMIVTTAYMGDQTAANNWCLRLDNDTLEAADVTSAKPYAGTMSISQSVFACEIPVRSASLIPSAINVQTWITSGAANAQENFTMVTGAAGTDPTAAMDANLIILENGFYSIPVADMVVNGVSLAGQLTPADGADFIGAVSQADDWTLGWTYGLHAGSRAQPLWFE